MVTEFDENSTKILTRGLYISYLKIQSSIELVKVMVKSSQPNILPSFKLRDNPNVSEEEWKFLKSLRQDPKDFNELEVNSKKFEFIQLIYNTIKLMCKDLDLNDLDMTQLRIIVSQIIEINSDVTLILICPPAEQICVTSNTDENIPSKNKQESSSSNNLKPIDYQHLKTNSNSALSFLKSNEFINLPVQIFEALNLISYDLKFIKVYVKLSIILDIEFQASNQFNREAFSNEEINNSKRILNLVNRYQKLLEDIWKKSRWMIETINIARDKSSLSHVVPLNNLDIFLKKYDFVSHNITEFEKKQMDLKNIYNEISKLPYNLDSSKKSIPNSQLNIDSFDEEQTPTQKNLDTCFNLKNESDKKKYTLLSKIYISPLQSPTSPTKFIESPHANIKNNSSSEFFFDYKPKLTITNHLSSPDTSVSSSISYPSTTDSSNTSKSSNYDRNIIIICNFDTGLKIDVNFDCYFNNQTTCKDIIRNILRRVNSFKEMYHRINGTDVHELNNNEDDEEFLSSSDLNKMFENYDVKNDGGKILTEDTDLYYLFVVLDELRVKVLMNDFKISTLRDPWSKGNFYMKKKV